MKKTLTLLTILMLLVFMVGCENSINPIKSDNLTVNEAYGAPEVYRILAKHAITSEAKLGDLIAGQNEVVGGVYISHRVTDGKYPAENLKIVLGMAEETDYYLTESHVMVTTAVDGEGNPVWPDGTVNKAGNPRPDEFPYYSEMPATTPGYNYFHHWPYIGYGPGNDAHVYHIPWESGWVAETEIYIAVHAKVAKEVPIFGDVVVSDCWDSVWQIGDVETKFLNTNHYELTFYADEFNYSAINKYPSFTAPFIVGTTPTNEFPYLTRGDNSYATNFDVQWDGELPFGGRFTISWSPGGSGSEIKIVTVPDGTPVTIGPVIGAFEYGNEWYLDKYPLTENSFSVDPLTFGTHLFNLLHTTGDGAYWDWVRLEKPCTEIGIVGYETVYESVWAYGDFFEGKNWSMNFGWYWDGSYGVNGHNNGVFILPSE